MKKFISILCGFALIASVFVGCSDAIDGSGMGNETRAANSPVSITLHLLYADTTKNWQVWAWTEPGKKNYSSKGWPGNLAMTPNADKSEWTYTLTNADTTQDLGCLFVDRSGAPQTSDSVIPKAKLTAGANFYYIYGDTKAYESADDCMGMKSAIITNAACTNVNVVIYGMGNYQPTDFTVKDKDGTALTVSKVTSTTTSATLTISGGGLAKTPYKIKYGETEIYANIDTGIIDQAGMNYDGDDLGVTVSGGTATFKTWAPTASKVELLLFADATAAGGKNAQGEWQPQPTEPNTDDIKEMTLGTKGVWSISSVNVSGKKYYKYRITTSEFGTNDVADIWSYAASADSVASQIVDINADASAKPDDWEASYTNPFGNNGSETKKNSQAVIYEMHIWDFGAAVTGSKGGKFVDIESDEIIKHLQDLGVTHVQILPMFDYAQINADTSYNWGYNPYHYNVPEGRYVDNMRDGTDAVKQMREMIKKLHDNGIAVIMDVVYNHTSGTGKGSLYDMTVPKYFYRLDANGNYANGSGCGNETASNHKMFKKYMIDSLKHWMNDYHINGFRFDLMGLHEASVMKEIYDELYKIDKNVLIHGEPWSGGTSPCVGPAVKAGKGDAGTGYAAFDDGIRDAVKGGVFERIGKGHVQGSFNDAKIIAGMTAGGSRNETRDLNLSLRYVEAHDNNTLFDKLVLSQTRTTDTAHAAHIGDMFAELSSATIASKPASFASNLDYVKAENKLAAAYVLLSQGTPFLNGGQEFMRSKMGNDNSYGGENSVTKEQYEQENKIDFSFKQKYADVYQTYRGLIALRRANPGDFGDNKNVTATTPKAGITKYTTTNFTIYFNATDADYAINETGKVVDVTGGIKITGFNSLFSHSHEYAGDDANGSYVSKFKIAKEATTVNKVKAKDFVILKK